jgi:hypothetical protein
MSSASRTAAVYAAFRRVRSSGESPRDVHQPRELLQAGNQHRTQGRGRPEGAAPGGARLGLEPGRAQDALADALVDDVQPHQLRELGIEPTASSAGLNVVNACADNSQPARMDGLL